MDYNALETELATKLNTYFAATVLAGSTMLDTVFMAREMPEDDSEFSRDTGKAIVNVCYRVSEYDKSTNTSQIVQNETVVVAFYLQGRHRKGNNGINALLGHLKTCLLGYRPINSKDRMSISATGEWQFEGEGVQPFIDMSFNTQSAQVAQTAPEDIAIGGPLTQATSIPAT